jgi:hypothetical protein
MGRGSGGHGLLRQELRGSTSLSDVADDDSERRLRALSVNSVEELLGLIEADPDAVAEFVPALDLQQVQADVPAAATAEFERFADPSFAMGALPPDEVEAEESASASYVESWLPEAEVETAADAGESPTVDLRECFGDVRHQGDRGTCVAHAVLSIESAAQPRRRRSSARTGALAR